MTETPTSDVFLVLRLADEVRHLSATLDTAPRDLAAPWHAARHESRAGVLLWVAWHHRHHEAPTAPGPAGDRARTLHVAARDLVAAPQWAHDMWFGAHWPLWPLPGDHGQAAAVLAATPGLALDVALALQDR